MWFHSLFDTLFVRSSRTRSRKRRLAPSIRRHRRFFRPRLEILEDRTLLSTYVVNSLTDTGAGSGLTGDLRYCITNATSGNDTITFGVTGTIQLQSALPTLNANVNIQGPGADQLTVKGGIYLYYPYYFAASIFTVGSASDVQVSGLTLADASPAIVNDGSVALNNCTLANNIGGLLNYGSATVSNSTISNGDDAIENSSGGTATVNYSTISGNSNAILNSGSLTINNSTLSGNEAIGDPAFTFGSPEDSSLAYYPASDGLGGSIYMSGGALSINSSTIADNEAIGGSSAGLGYYGGYAGNGYGGGLYIAGGTVSINNSTLADNQAIGGSGYYFYSGSGYGGGIYNAAGPSALQMYDTILADDTGDVGPDLYGGVTSLGHNLIGNSAGGSGFTSSDLVNINPQLGPLQNNGGPTQTMAPLAGSPAIDAGDNTNAPAYDQRGPGYPRIVNGTIDIGALEVSNETLAVSGFPSTTTAGDSQTFTVTALKPDGTTDTSYTGTVHFTSSDPKAVLPADATLSNGSGQFSAALETAGYQWITAAGVNADTEPEGDILVVPAGASSFLVSGFPSPTTSGTTYNFYVQAYDSYGNRTTDYNGTVHFSSSDPLAALPADTTLSNGYGLFTATLKTVGDQSIIATDTQNATLTGSQSDIQVLPLATITGPSAGYLNETLKFTLGASSAPAGTNFTFTINWGDGSAIQTVTAPSGTTVSHSYSTSGTRSIAVTATDPGGFTSNPVYQWLNILPVSVTIETDPANTSRQMLVIDGTANNDSIVLAGNGNDVSLSFDGTPLGDIKPTNGYPFALVMVFGEAGNDVLDARNLALSSVLVGGSGNDTLYGGSAPNLLIGGSGSDTLYAGSAGDILIGGYTSYDNNPTALAFIMAEWDSADSYTTRINKIMNGVGPNGSYALNKTTVFDDNAVDMLYGGAGMDWFFAHKKGKNADKVNGQTGGEVITSI